MARYSFWDLVGMQPPGYSHPIGVMQRRPRLTATLSRLNASGDVEFGPEIPIEVEFGLLQLPPIEKDSEQFRVWIGFEVQTMEKTLRDATLVMATYPYSTDWFDWSDFKPTLKRSRETRLEPFRATLDEIQHKFRSRSALPYEIVDSRPGLFTARLSSPTRTAGLSVTARPGRKEKEKIWKKVQSSNNRRHPQNAPELWCHGVCLEFEKCKEALRSSEAAVDLAIQLENGTLFNKYASAGRAEFQGIGPEGKSYHESVLDAAIIKTLAGNSPVLDRIQRRRDPKLAAPLMAQIYKQTMHNLVRRLKEPDSQIHIPKNSEGFASRPEKEEPTPFEELVERYAPYGKRGLPEAARHEMHRCLDRGSEAEQLTACAILAAIAKAGFQLPRKLKLRLREICDDTSESAEVRRAARAVLDIVANDELPDRED